MCPTRSFVICPSILNADFFCLKQTLDTLRDHAITQLHLDVMDGHFVPNISFGAFLVKQIRARYDFFLDVHLMVTQPQACINAFVQAGANSITFHWEATAHADSLVRTIHQQHVQVGVALNPATPLQCCEYLYKQVDKVLLMSVNPGAGGQTFIPYIFDKLDHLREQRDRHNPQLRIGIDGGVKIDHLHALRQAGADEVVVGSFLFDPQTTVDKQLQRLYFALEHDSV